jgi:hypothetical protein
MNAANEIAARRILNIVATKAGFCLMLANAEWNAKLVEEHMTESENIYLLTPQICLLSGVRIPATTIVASVGRPGLTRLCAEKQVQLLIKLIDFDSVDAERSQTRIRTSVQASRSGGCRV